MEKTELWGKVLEDLSGIFTSETIKTFVKPAKLREINENPPIAYIEAPNNKMITLALKQRFLHQITESFKNVTGLDYKVVIKNSSEFKAPPRVIEQEPEPALFSYAEFQKELIFDPNETFDNFIVGDCNEYAAAVCRAIANSPFNLYNPLFIYGKSGLGKTHLLNAVGIHLLENNDDMRIIYITAETFLNDFTEATAKHKMNEFKNKYRNADVLLVDDIQLLERTDKTQEEFFNTFNTLLHNNKQIIVAGDRPPGNLTALDERLRSRFLMKITAGVTAPDFETRVAILKNDAENRKLPIDDNMNEIINYIADNFKNNIRELKGAFENAVNVPILLNKDFTLNNIKTHIKDSMMIGGSITPQKIKDVVCKYYNISIENIESESRRSSYAYPRQIAIYLIRNMTDYSLNRIGSLFGNKHYSTVKHACDKIESDLKIIPSLKEEVEEIKKLINI